MTAAVKHIVTNNTTEIRTFKLLSGEQSKINSSSHEIIWLNGVVAPLLELDTS
jgi:hypothetical protein